MIREFNPQDRKAIDRLMVKLQKHFAEVDMTKESLPFKDQKVAHDYMQRMIDDSGSMNGVIYVAEEANSIIGFIQGVVINHRPGDDVVFDATHIPRRDGWIGLLFVEPSHRAKGIGQKLMDKIKNHFENEGCDTLRLLVLSDNTHVIEIYKKYGFIKHEVEMVRKLKP